MKYTYLLIDFCTIIVPFLFSFHPKLRFYRNWPAFFPAAVLTGLIFIGWDMYFTHLKVWGFNPTYLTGIYVGNLPLEEVLFFLCIPYSCVFTYACLTLLIKTRLSKQFELFLNITLISLSVLLAVIFHHLSYTAYTFVVLAGLLFTAKFILKVTWLPGFYVTYLVLLIPFLIVNGLLTGTGLAAPVVWYNPAQMVNLRILTIPVEDVFYGMDLILLNVIIYSYIRSKAYQNYKARKKAEASIQRNIVYTNPNIF